MQTLRQKIMESKQLKSHLVRAHYSEKLWKTYQKMIVNNNSDFDFKKDITKCELCQKSLKGKFSLLRHVAFKHNLLNDDYM